MFHFDVLPPLSLYIHIPWCVKKCPYCDFNSHTYRTSDDFQIYIDAVVRDLEQSLPAIWGRRIQTIFIGGGTPSLVPADVIEKMLCDIRARLQYKPDMEITLEANPGTLDNQIISALGDTSINRLSIGVQSLDASKLTSLGRIHSPEQAIQAFAAARAAGFDNINLDMMFGLPDQTQQQALDDLSALLQLSPEHISYYQLTLEPNTLFAHSPPPIPDDDASWDIQQQGHALLNKYAFEQYEVSAFAKPGHQCKHNLNYWEFGDYLGIGAGAHSKITNQATHHIERWMKFKNPAEYMQAVNVGNANQTTARLAAADVPFEFMLNALRLNRGFTMDLYEQHSGLKMSAILPVIELAIEQGLVEYNNNHYLPTNRGRQYLNNLIEMFLPD